MAKFSFSYRGDEVVILNEQNQKQDRVCELLEAVDLPTAFKVLTKGRQADEKASDVSIGMLSQVLDDPRLSIYKGKTPADQRIPVEFLQTLRDLENEVFKRAFVDSLMARRLQGVDISTEAGHRKSVEEHVKAESEWQIWRKVELTTGSYSNAKSFVAKLFCHVGQTPKAPNGKLLPLHAIRRMYETWKDGQESTTSVAKTIAGKLVTISEQLRNSPDEETVGELPDAIAALKFMLATCETMYRVQLERLTEQKGNPSITTQSAAVIGQAQRVKSDKSKEAAEVAPI